jgi:hypothetical protein
MPFLRVVRFGSCVSCWQCGLSHAFHAGCAVWANPKPRPHTRKTLTTKVSVGSCVSGSAVLVSGLL